MNCKYKNNLEYTDKKVGHFVYFLNNKILFLINQRSLKMFYFSVLFIFLQKRTKMSSKRSSKYFYLKAFPQKLWYLINLNNETSIQWTESGESILIDSLEFSIKFIKTENIFFKYSNYNSFVRQLNLYGFKKLSKRIKFDNIQEYKHKYFIRDREDLLEQVKRKYFENRSLTFSTKIDSMLAKRKPFTSLNECNRLEPSAKLASRHVKWTSKRNRKISTRKLDSLDWLYSNGEKNIFENQTLNLDSKPTTKSEDVESNLNNEYIFASCEPSTSSMTTIINQNCDDPNVKGKVSEFEANDSYIFLGVSPYDNFYISCSELFQSLPNIDSLHLACSDDFNSVSNHVITLSNPEQYELESGREEIFPKENIDSQPDIINHDLFLSQYNFTSS